MRLSVQNPEWKMSYGCDACNPRSRFLRDGNKDLPKGQQDKYPKFINRPKSLVRHTGSLQEARILAQSRPWNSIVRPAPALNEKLVRNRLVQRISANASGAATTIALRRTDIRENDKKFNEMIQHRNFHILRLIAKKPKATAGRGWRELC